MVIIYNFLHLSDYHLTDSIKVNHHFCISLPSKLLIKIITHLVCPPLTREG